LKFVPSAAKYIREKIWHESQHLQVNPDQSVTMTLSLRSLIEVRRWVLSWGSECEVLAPAALKDDIRREASLIVARSSSDANAATMEKMRERVASRPRPRKQTG